ncbi:MAG: hypothetical protein VZT48_09300 [Bulleidia sp.]|nr:hypothetical protein [Bulleidia sp.]
MGKPEQKMHDAKRICSGSSLISSGILTTALTWGLAAAFMAEGLSPKVHRRKSRSALTVSPVDICEQE